MKNKNTDAQTDLFSSDPEQNLRIENEILHLRIKAELGGEIMGNGMGKEPLPPDVENQFLKNILEFERAYANTRQIKIYEFLGKPSFKKPDELNDEELESALNELRFLLESKNISLDFSSEYDVLLK